MPLRDHLDNIRESWIANPNIAPTRTILYRRSSDDLEVSIDCFIGGGEHNIDLADDQKVNSITCSGLKLDLEPTKTDIITYNGKEYQVREWDFLGTLYRVSAENQKRNKVSARKFK